MKNNQTGTIVLGIAAGALVFLGLKAVTSQPEQAQDNTPKGVGTIEFSETNWELGEIPMSKGVNTKEIKIKNPTEFPVQITGMQTSCMCTSAQIVHANGKKSAVKGMVGHGGGTATMLETINAGEEVTLLVNFDPNAHGPDATGPITRDVSITTNNPEKSDWDLTFGGIVIK
ncbi:DUF1573 domain-containing protein [Candidatus Uhrbacteria bacterium]|nr:DUF1573 domain-containing protein [Candidatus Uhrbacteria bacterium]